MAKRKAEVPSQAWILLETSYEYDDSSYSSNGAGAPVKVFMRYETAQKALLDANRNWFSDNNFSDYVDYDKESISPEGLEILNKYDAVQAVMLDTESETKSSDPEEDDDGEWLSHAFKEHFRQFCKTATDQQLADVLEHVSIEPFKIVPITIED